MAKFDEPIRDLLSSAQANTGDNRALVFRHVVRQLCRPENISEPRDLRLLLDIYDALAPSIEPSVRQVVSRAIADTPGVAPGLIERLAVDGAKIAAPVIKRSAIDNATLLRIVKRTGKAHHLMIAERADLGPAVWQALSGDRPSPAAMSGKRELKLAPISVMLENAIEAQKNAAREEFPALKKLSDLAVEADVNMDQPIEPDPLLETVAELETAQAGAALQEPGVRSPLPPRKIVLPSGPGFDHGLPTRPSAATSETPSLPLPQEHRLPAGDRLPSEGLGAADFAWKTDRHGRVVEVSENAYKAFGRAAETMTGLFFFALVEPVGDHDKVAALGRMLTRHLPIREFPVEIEADRNRRAIWALTGRACFDRTTGRFSGYEGQAIAVGDDDKRPGILSAAPVAMGASALEHLCREAGAPIGELLGAAGQLSQRARQKKDRTAMSDLLTVLDAGYRLKTMIEDMEYFVDPDATLVTAGRTAFTIRAAVADCLEKDTVRHGGLSRFRLTTGSADAQINFDEQLLRRALIRALEVVRTRGGQLHDPDIDINLGGGGRIEISVPTGDGGNYGDLGAILFLPADRLAGVNSSVVARESPVFSAELGLSIARQQMRALGGDIRIEMASGDVRTIILSFPLGH